MLDFRWECIYSKLNKVQEILQTFMLAPLFFTNILSVWKQGSKLYQTLFVICSTIHGSYLSRLLFIRHTMLDHPVFTRH